MDNEVFEQFMTIDGVFDRESKRIASQKHCPLQDTRSLLLSWLYFKVRQFDQNNPDKDLSKILSDSSDPDYQKIINLIYYAGHEVVQEISRIRDHTKLNHNGKAERLDTVDYIDNIFKKSPVEVGNQTVDFDRLIEITYTCLRSDSAEFCCDLILNGSEAVKERYGYTTGELNKRIKRISKTMETRRKKHPELFLSARQKQNLHNFNILKEFVDLLDSPTYTDEKMQELLAKYADQDVMINIIADNSSGEWYTYCFGRPQQVQSDYKIVDAIYREYSHLKERINHGTQA